MQIFVKALSGKTLTLDVAATADVHAVKAAIMDAEGVPVEMQLLSAAGSMLSNSATLAEAGVTEEMTLDLCVPVVGGVKKRKKKVYSTPKVVKRKHKSEKLATLKFYEVDADGKVVKKRLECPSCGVGVFMALHHNRHYCGRCGRTAPREEE
jgi:small subunit ribosomal protein S27Ae